MVKAILYVQTDVEGRRLGYRTGLDTLIVLAENDECHKLEWLGLEAIACYFNPVVKWETRRTCLLYTYHWLINESVSIPPQE